MTQELRLTDLPDDLARFVEGQMAEGRFSTVEDVLRACVDALRERNERPPAAIAKYTAE